MHQFLPSDLETFLRKTDSYLSETCELLIVGGAAATIAYQANRTTSDIDTQNELGRSLVKAFEKARAETGFQIPVNYVGGLCEGPVGFESRWQPVFEDLKMLKILVPERHDLALMKIVRGQENDIQAIIDIHQNHPFELEILKGRFINDMTHVTGLLIRIRGNFLDAIVRLYGDKIATEIEIETAEWGQPKMH